MLSKIKLLYSKHKKYFFFFISLILILLIGRLLIKNIDLLVDGIKAFVSADPTWIIFGLIIFFSAIPLVTAILILLSYKKLDFWLTYKVQMALLFVNKILTGSLNTLLLTNFAANALNSPITNTATEKSTRVFVNAL